MRIGAGSILSLHIEKPVAGGRMLARHDGQAVLVSGAIPGERVRARVERVGRGVLHAATEEVLEGSPDRRDAGGDWRCGGGVYAHIAYERQVRLKGEIVRETLGRIGRLPLTEPPAVVGSPERGYRMRARLHARDGRLGFFREGTHQLCDPVTTGQLLSETLAWIADAERFLRDRKLTGLAGVELTENVPGNERACFLDLESGTDAELFAPLLGRDAVSDVVRVTEDESAPALRVRHSPRSFFQSNRFLLNGLVRRVVALVPEGPVVDLYAGVGLFGLSLASAGVDDVTLVEGDSASADDLMINAEPFASRARVERSSVEAFLVSDAGLTGRGGPARATFIVDPPRTGISKEAMAGIIHVRPARIVYVSCDVATLARDTRLLLDGGYQLGPIVGMDLFPNTGHIETIAAFSR